MRLGVGDCFVRWVRVKRIAYIINQRSPLAPYTIETDKTTVMSYFVFLLCVSKLAKFPEGKKELIRLQRYLEEIFFGYAVQYFITRYGVAVSAFMRRYLAWPAL